VAIGQLTFEIHAEELIIRGHLGEDFLFNGGRAGLNPVEDRGIEHVDAGVDLVGDEDLGLLDELVNMPVSVGLGDNHTILGGLIHLGDEDRALLSVVPVELQHLLERERADNVTVEHKEGRVVLSQNLLGKGQRTGGAQRLGLHREVNLDFELMESGSAPNWAAKKGENGVVGGQTSVSYFLSWFTMTSGL